MALVSHIEGGFGSNDPGANRSMFPIRALLNLQELPDFPILLPHKKYF